MRISPMAIRQNSFCSAFIGFPYGTIWVCAHFRKVSSCAARTIALWLGEFVERGPDSDDAAFVLWDFLAL